MKTKYDPTKIPTIVMWAEEGLREIDICKRLGCGKSAFYEWKQRYPEFAEALKSAKDVADSKVVNALYDKALGGDTTAMIFWLKNRKPEQWRDKRDLAVGGKEGGDGITIKVVRPDGDTVERGIRASS